MEISAFWSLILLLISLTIITLRLLKPANKLINSLPGPFKLPIIGNLHQLAGKNIPPHKCLLELARIHGPVMHLRLGEVSTVVISSAEAAKEVLRTQDTNFATRPKLLVGKMLYYNYSDIALAPYGEYWRQVRKIATLELFTTRKVDSFRAIREEEVSSLVESITLKAAAECSVNLSSLLFGLAFDLTTRTVLNKRGKDQKAFRALASEMSKVLSGFAIADLYPSIKWLPTITGMTRKLNELIRESNRLLDPIISEHKLSNNERSHDTVEDLVDVLLKFHREDPVETEFSLTIDNIKAIILEIFGAGSETSSATIEWVMSELLKNPKAMERAQREVRQVYRGKTTMDETSLDELVFLKMVIKETLRLHPPVPLMLPRESINQCKLIGFEIPAKTRVIINASAIGRDPVYWADANVFKPERFEGSALDYKGTNFEFVPFGAGRRMCPGIALGIANIELPLAMLLYHFDWKLPGGMPFEKLDMDEFFGLSVKRKHDLHAMPISYAESFHSGQCT